MALSGNIFLNNLGDPSLERREKSSSAILNNHLASAAVALSLSGASIVKIDVAAGTDAHGADADEDVHGLHECPADAEVRRS